MMSSFFMCTRCTNSSLASSKKQENKRTYLTDDANVQAFRNQLRKHHLKLRNIIGDGNCLFRSFADQMDGDQNLYPYYREKIWDFIQINRQDFEPFITGRSFDEFLQILSRDGTFGGNECLVAFSRLYNAKICVHQLNQPVWIVCFSDSPQHEIHISYHNFEHYSSVRKLGDMTSRPADVRQSITTNENTCPVNRSVDLSNEDDIDYIQSQIKNTINRQLIRDILNENNGNIDETLVYFLSFDISTPPIQESNESIEKIMSVTGIYDMDFVRQSYENNHFDIELTVERLLTITTEDNKKKLGDRTIKKTKTKTGSESNHQNKIEKKQAKKQRAMERHCTQIVTGNKITEQDEGKLDTSASNEQEYVPPVNMEFINI